MEASGTSPATDTSPAHVSFLDRLRGFALTVEHRITPSEVQDVLSGVVALLDHAGLDIPEPEPPAQEASQEELQARNADLQRQIDELKAQQTQPPAPPAAPSGTGD